MRSERTILMRLIRAKTMEEVQEICINRSEELDECESQCGIQVQNNQRFQSNQQPHAQTFQTQQGNQQSPSMQRIMANNPDLIPRVAPPSSEGAAKALEARAALIATRGVKAGEAAPRKG